MPDKQSDVARRNDQSLTRRQTPVSPFQMLERFADDVDRMFDDFGFGRRWSGRGGWSGGDAEQITWAPRIDVAHRDNQLVIRADLPGLSKEDVKVDVTEDGLTIQGERKRDHEEE